MSEEPLDCSVTYDKMAARVVPMLACVIMALLMGFDDFLKTYPSISVLEQTHPSYRVDMVQSAMTCDWLSEKIMTCYVRVVQRQVDTSLIDMSHVKRNLITSIVTSQE